ncbi:SSS family transporter [Evansella vedderi]|uniref:SSS family transporter n=1 Tax=Evansella vedderi TaxID=38282 RepID=A0ABT9ZNM7_9BACI|nr:hypothetical protein [Evansella vedderi]MDQ0252817.1 SSS family transporter [Evansella vedderi]
MDITIIVISVYLICMVIIGFLYRKKASKGMESYLVADRSMGPIIGGGALASTYASTSSFLGSLGAMYVFGISFGLWQNTGVLIGFLISSLFLAPKFRKFGLVSFSQFFESRYDKRVRGVGALITIATMFVYIMVQLQGGAYAMQFVLGTTFSQGVIIIGSIFIIYVVLGGSHSSIKASFIQFLMMVIAMFSVVMVAIFSNPWGEITTQALATEPAFFNLWGSQGVLYSLSVGLMMSLGVMSSPHVYMMYMVTKSEKVAQKTTALATTYLSLFYFSLLFVAVYIMSQFPSIENPDMGYFYTLDVFPAVIVGLFIAAVLAAAMSSTDAQLLNATGAITNDIYSVIYGKPISSSKVVLINRVIAVILGSLAIIVSLNPPQLILFVMALAQSMMIGAFLVPLVLGLWWKKATANGALAGMFGGFGIALITQFIPMPNPFLGGPLGAIVSLIIMVSVSLMDKSNRIDYESDNKKVLTK